MSSQFGISIAAVVVAIIAIVVSIGMVSSISQDLVELKTTIDEQNQVLSRGVIDQQGAIVSKMRDPSKGEESITTLPLTKFYEPQFSLRVQGMNEVIDILLIAELNVPLTNQDKQGLYKIQKIIKSGKMTPELFNSIQSVIKDISNENDLNYDCQDLSGNLAEFGSDTGEISASDDCPSGTTMCMGVCCDFCIRGTCV